MLNYKPLDLAIGGLLLEGTGATLFTFTTFTRAANLRDQCDVPATIYCFCLFIFGIAVIVVAHRRAKASLWRLLFMTNFWGAGSYPSVYLYFNGRHDWGSVVCLMWGIVVGMVVGVCKEGKLRDKTVDEEDLSKSEYARTDIV